MSRKTKSEYTTIAEKRMQEDIQNLINEYNKKVEDKLAEKEDELMKV